MISNLPSSFLFWLHNARLVSFLLSLFRKLGMHKIMHSFLWSLGNFSFVYVNTFYILFMLFPWLNFVRVNGFSPESCQIFFGVAACLSQVKYFAKQLNDTIYNSKYFLLKYLTFFGRFPLKIGICCGLWLHFMVGIAVWASIKSVLIWLCLNQKG